MSEDVGKLRAAKGPGARGLSEEEYHRLHPKLTATFRSLGAGAEESRDLTQEALLRAHRGLGGFEGRAQLDTWVVSIAKKVWLQHWRDQGRHKRSGEEVPLDAVAGKSADLANPEARVVAKDLLGRVGRAIRGLPELMQQALGLHLGGARYRDIATILGVTESKVASLIHQARKKLRREIGGEPAEGGSTHG